MVEEEFGDEENCNKDKEVYDFQLLPSYSYYKGNEHKIFMQEEDKKYNPNTVFSMKDFFLTEFLMDPLMHYETQKKVLKFYTFLVRLAIRLDYAFFKIPKTEMEKVNPFDSEWIGRPETFESKKNCKERIKIMASFDEEKYTENPLTENPFFLEFIKKAEEMLELFPDRKDNDPWPVRGARFVLIRLKREMYGDICYLHYLRKEIGRYVKPEPEVTEQRGWLVPVA